MFHSHPVCIVSHMIHRHGIKHGELPEQDTKNNRLNKTFAKQNRFTGKVSKQLGKLETGVYVAGVRKIEKEDIAKMIKKIRQKR